MMPEKLPDRPIIRDVITIREVAILRPSFAPEEYACFVSEDGNSWYEHEKGPNKDGRSKWTEKPEPARLFGKERTIGWRYEDTSGIPKGQTVGHSTMSMATRGLHQMSYQPGEVSEPEYYIAVNHSSPHHMIVGPLTRIEKANYQKDVTNS